LHVDRIFDFRSGSQAAPSLHAMASSSPKTGLDKIRLRAFFVARIGRALITQVMKAVPAVPPQENSGRGSAVFETRRMLSLYIADALASQI
jgi:hypothetical protein